MRTERNGEGVGGYGWLGLELRNGLKKGRMNGIRIEKIDALGLLGRRGFGGCLDTQGCLRMG